MVQTLIHVQTTAFLLSFARGVSPRCGSACPLRSFPNGIVPSGAVCSPLDPVAHICSYLQCIVYGDAEMPAVSVLLCAFSVVTQKQKRRAAIVTAGSSFCQRVREVLALRKVGNGCLWNWNNCDCTARERP